MKKKTATERFKFREEKKRQNHLVLKAFTEAVARLKKNVLKQ